MECLRYVLYAVAIGVGWLLAYYVHPRVIQKLALQRDLIASFLIPFQTWCRDLYKELTEFRGRYSNERVYDNLSKTLIIIDYRELHDVLREEGKYRGKIEEENPKVAKYLDRLERLVDDLWHRLQDIFSVNFDQSEHDEWIAAVIECKEKEELVKAIKERSGELLEHFGKEEFKELTDYLVEQIPKWGKRTRTLKTRTMKGTLLIVVGALLIALAVIIILLSSYKGIWANVGWDACVVALGVGSASLGIAFWGLRR